MSKKSVLESCDNVKHDEYLDYMFQISLYDMWADDVRWLKKFKYVPVDKCVVCGSEVSKYSCICFNCKDKGKKVESVEVKKYIEKNKRLY